MDCSICGRNAFYRRRYSGEVFCRTCYPEAFERRVQETITSKKMLRPTERLAVGVSGGKDSVSLLHVLTNLEKRFPSAQLVAVTVDEGIRGYRNEAIDIAASYSKKLGIEHHLLSFSTLYGCTLDEIAQRARELGQDTICAYCGILRRKALNVAAKNVAATKLTTAHNLDDEAQSILMSLLRGTINDLQRSENTFSGTVPRVKPFMTSPEKETALYAYLKRLEFQSVPCPYASTSMRNEVRGFLDTLEEEHPGMKYNVLSTFEKLSFPTGQEVRKVGKCQKCGEPTAREVCRACEVLETLGLAKNSQEEKLY